jgi:hypothetical protein
MSRENSNSNNQEDTPATASRSDSWRVSTSSHNSPRGLGLSEVDEWALERHSLEKMEPRRLLQTVRNEAKRSDFFHDLRHILRKRSRGVLYINDPTDFRYKPLDTVDRVFPERGYKEENIKNPSWLANVRESRREAMEFRENPYLYAWRSNDRKSLFIDETRVKRRLANAQKHKFIERPEYPRNSMDTRGYIYFGSRAEGNRFYQFGRLDSFEDISDCEMPREEHLFAWSKNYVPAWRSSDGSVYLDLNATMKKFPEMSSSLKAGRVEEASREQNDELKPLPAQPTSLLGAHRPATPGSSMPRDHRRSITPPPRQVGQSSGRRF